MGSIFTDVCKILFGQRHGGRADGGDAVGQGKAADSRKSLLRTVAEVITVTAMEMDVGQSGQHEAARSVKDIFFRTESLRYLQFGDKSARCVYRHGDEGVVFRKDKPVFDYHKIPFVCFDRMRVLFITIIMPCAAGFNRNLFNMVY